jgi:ankyrin repeat protein
MYLMCPHMHHFIVEPLGRADVSDGKFSIETRDEAGCTALAVAALNKQTSVVAELLRLGADVNAQCRSGQTALIHASRLGLLDVVKV